MLHSHTRIFIHLIWATKSRERMLTKDVRPMLRRQLADYARDNNIHCEALNAQMEHVQGLISLQSTQKIDDVVKLLKGESSHWINEQNLLRGKFSWQRGYAALSVSPSHVERLKLYINNQDEHHRRRTFAEEYPVILKKYGFSLEETDESGCWK